MYARADGESQRAVGSGRPPGGRGRYRRSHELFTPCLTGLGERAHLASPTVTLTTHVQDVVNHVLHEDLADIVLLGFSYGGLFVTGSLNEVGERVRHLVYLDAFVPGDGDSLASMMSIPEVVPPPARSYDDEDEAAFMAARRVPHPLACFSERVRLARPLEAFPFQRSYIRATADAPDAPGAAAFDAAAKRARDSAAWHYHEIATSHMVASNRPAELAALLATCA